MSNPSWLNRLNQHGDQALGVGVSTVANSLGSDLRGTAQRIWRLNAYLPAEDEPEDRDMVVYHRMRIPPGVARPANQGLFTQLRLFKEPIRSDLREELFLRAHSSLTQVAPPPEGSKRGGYPLYRSSGEKRAGDHERRRVLTLERTVQTTADAELARRGWGDGELVGVGIGSKYYRRDPTRTSFTPIYGGDWQVINEKAVTPELIRAFSRAINIQHPHPIMQNVDGVQTIMKREYLDLLHVLDLPVFSFDYSAPGTGNFETLNTHFGDILSNLPQFRENTTRNRVDFNLIAVRLEPFGIFKRSAVDRKAFEGSFLNAYRRRASEDERNGSQFADVFIAYISTPLPEGVTNIDFSSAGNRFSIRYKAEGQRSELLRQTMRELLTFFSGSYDEDDMVMSISRVAVAFKMIKVSFRVTQRNGPLMSFYKPTAPRLNRSRMNQLIETLQTFNPEEMVFKIPKEISGFFIGDRSINSRAQDKKNTAANFESCRDEVFTKWVWCFFNVKMLPRARGRQGKPVSLKTVVDHLQGKKKSIFELTQWVGVYELQRGLIGFEWIDFMIRAVTWCNWVVYQVLISPKASITEPSTIILPDEIKNDAPSFVLFQYTAAERKTSEVSVKSCLKEHVGILQPGSLNDFSKAIHQVRRISSLVPLKRQDRNLFGQKGSNSKRMAHMVKNEPMLGFEIHRALFGVSEARRKIQEEKSKTKGVFVSWDIETLCTINREPFLSVLFFPEKNFFKVFQSENCISDTWDFLKKQAKETSSHLKVWTMNGSRFDVMYILPFIEDAQISGTHTNAKRVFIHFPAEKASIEFLDISLTLQGSLNTLAKTFGVGEKAESGGFEFYTSIQSIQENIGMEKVIDYCKQDTALVYKIYNAFRNTVNDFFKKEYIPETFISASSLAFNIWLNHFFNYDSQEPLKGLLRNELEDIKNSYFGGLTQVYRTKLDGGFYYDINSSYPSVMMNAVPINLAGISNQRENLDSMMRETRLNRLEEYLVLFKLDFFEFPLSTEFPVIPVRTKTGNLYPLRHQGESWVWCHTLAFLEKHIPSFKASAIRAYVFHKRDIFSDMIKKVYPLKSDPRAPVKTFAKLLMNSVYGKTGQKLFPERVLKGRMSKDTPLPEVYEVLSSLDRTYDRKKPKFLREFTTLRHKEHISFLVDYEDDSENPSHSGALLFIASFITSLARLKLLDLVYESKKEGIKTFYVDTDSVFTNKPIPKKYIDPSALGLWKQECQVVKARFFGAKSYIYEDTNGKTVKKFKGVPKSELDKLDLWRLESEELLEVHIDQIWKRQWGNVLGGSMTKILKKTLNRRNFDSNGESIPLISVEDYKE